MAGLQKASSSASVLQPLRRARSGPPVIQDSGRCDRCREGRSERSVTREDKITVERKKERKKSVKHYCDRLTKNLEESLIIRLPLVNIIIDETTMFLDV